MAAPPAAGLGPVGVDRAHEWLAELQALARIGIWEWVPGAGHASWSAEMYRIHGMPVGDGRIGYHEVSAMVHPDDRARVQAEIQRGVATGLPCEVEYRVVQPGGAERTVVARCRILEERGARRLVGTMQDVTDTRAGAREREEVRRLHEMDRFRARFLNMAAHELKTPLTPIRIQLELLSRGLGSGSEAQQRHLATLKRSVARLSSLVEDLLDAARLQATQLRVRRRPVDVAALVAEATESYRPVAAETGVELEVACEPGSVADADETRLLQVVNNLLSNALKFTPRGGTITTRARREGASVRIDVEDTGHGLTPEQAERLFQPFVQVHPDLEAGLKGTGLGLFIVKGIVEAHGGTIVATSRGAGLGTTFTVRLPGSSEKVAPQAAEPTRGSLRDRLRDLI